MDVASSVLGDIVTAVINGSDGCVLSFGHARLGKTWTMVGSSGGQGGANGWEAGLMPTAMAWLFRGIGEQKTKTGARFSVRVSAVEIAGANELLRDLLAPHATGNLPFPLTLSTYPSLPYCSYGATIKHQVQVAQHLSRTSPPNNPQKSYPIAHHPCYLHHPKAHLYHLRPTEIILNHAQITPNHLE